MGAACCKPETIDFTQEVELNHFELLRSIGKGAFGKVKVVKHKNSKNTYALKYINKEACIKMKAVDNIIQERKLLEEIHCPFVCNLRYAFQDDENMFMVIDLKLGGDLRFHLNKMGTLSEDIVQFYMAECALGLMYLHSKHVVHRDLKPDNILLDETGHACLTDFNIATYWKDDKPLNAVAGSMAYMAPEILDRVGYTYTIDWWSLGVIAYELLFGKSKKANFDATHELEEMLLEDNPLQAKPRKKDGKGGAVSKLDPKEAEKMETKYTLFDYTTLPPFEMRKKSAAWDNKIGEIQRSASSLSRESKVDIMENRSECILIDPDQQTIKSIANSVSELPRSSVVDAPEMPRLSAASSQQHGASSFVPSPSGLAENVLLHWAIGFILYCFSVVSRRHDLTNVQMKDFRGQILVERIFQVSLTVFGIVSFFAGYFSESLKLLVGINVVGLLLTMIIAVPPWPMYRIHPVKWQAARKKSVFETGKKKSWLLF
ncbi:UNVERIFIED_CONTAM: hypothetical protein HDU68_008247 [Siphonaria sp. JEL0065]|nr:hypothetical protein HDU68_008247 [Siphonaria sp. JEL0065]